MNSGNITRRSVGKLVAGAALATCMSTGLAAADVIKLGAPIPVTGYFAADGVTMEQAIKLAAKHINEGGGLLGKTVEVVTFDIGDLTPDKLQAAAANLIQREGVNVLINGYGGMGPDIPAFCPYGIPYIHNDAVSSVIDLAERSKCGAIFNASDVDVNYGEAVFKQILATGYDFAEKRLAIVNGNFEWDLNIAKGLEKAAKEAGWEVVYSEEVPYETTEWTGILSKIRAAKPSLVHLELLDPAVTTTFMSQFRDNPPENALLNIGYVGATPGVDEVMAQGGAESVLSFTLNAHLPGERGDAFIKQWEAEYGQKPAMSLAAAIYDMTIMWAEAVKKVGDATDYPAVADAIRALRYDGLTGKFQFNDRNYINTGDATQPAQLFQVQDKNRVRLMIGSQKTGEIVKPSWAK